MIEIKHLNKSYGLHKVIKDLSLTINQGEIYGLIGQNGAGKTTVFKAILGLSPINSGTISINSSTNLQELLHERKKIGFLIGQNFFTYFNARQNLKYYCKLKGITDYSEIDRVLSIVGLEKEKKKYLTYSMGMKQRLGIANALLGNPEILILDEPTNGLDPQGIMDVRNLIKNLKDKYNMTIIVSSHILNELSQTADRFGIVHKGKVLQEIYKKDLENNSSSLVLNVKEIEQVKAFIQENLPHIRIKEKNNLLYLFDVMEEDDILKKLMKKDFMVKELYWEHRSLEDFYFDIVKEAQHD